MPPAESLKAGDGRAQYTARAAKALPDSVINTTGVARARALVERDGVIMLDTQAPGGESLVFSGRINLGAAAAPAAPGAGSIIYRGSVDLSSPARMSGPVFLTLGDVAAPAQQQALQLTRPAARDIFPTDSVAKQIDYGFAGSVGPLPAYPHKLQKTGISLPE